MPKTLFPAHRVRLSRRGRDQIVPIPRDLELPGEYASIRKHGGRLIIEPVHRKSLLTILATLAPLEETFPPIDDPLPDPL